MRKKKLTRNILIAVIAVLVIAVVIFLLVALQKDGAGMNCFQRNATAATADGESVSMAEYRVTYDMIASNYQTTTLTDAQVKNLQEYAVQEALMQKIYTKEAKALGLTLTDEQKTAAKKSADNQIEAIEQYYAESMAKDGTYSKAAVDKQISAYYQRLGMSKDAYRKFLRESNEAELYRQAIETYYKENGSDISEKELVDYYRKTVEESMTVTGEDGTKTPAYTDGQYWTSLMMYQIGYSTPMLYVPEGFIYIDFVEVKLPTKEEAEELVRSVNEGDTDFDTLMASDENKDPYREILKAPYPIAENDHSGLFTKQEIYTKAAELQIGEIGSYIEERETTEEEAEDNGDNFVVVYLFRRAEGTMCYDGDHGVIKMEYYDGIRESVEEQMRQDRWFGDIKIEDAVYAYKGAIG